MTASTSLEARKVPPAAVAGLDLYDVDQYVVAPPHEKLKKLRDDSSRFSESAVKVRRSELDEGDGTRRKQGRAGMPGVRADRKGKRKRGG